MINKFPHQYPTPPLAAGYYWCGNKSVWMGLVLISIFIAGCAQTTSTTTTTIPIVAPSVPIGLRADSSLANTIDLIWQSTSETNIAGYNVYRSATPGSGYSKIATVKIGTAFWDTGTTITTSDSSAWVLHAAGTGLVAYPLPFDPVAQTTIILYRLTRSEDAALAIYNVLGQVVWNRTSLAGSAGGTVGINKITWDGKDNHANSLPNGIYPVKLSSGSTSEADYILIWNGTGGLTAGNVYYYAVTAFNTSGIESSYSVEVSAEARADGQTHWPTRIVSGSVPADPIFEYDPTLPSYR